MINTTVVVRGEAVRAKLAQLECGCVSETGASYEYNYKGAKFFIPKPLKDGGYTEAQLDIIEQIVANLGLDLRPLDCHLH